MNRRQVLSALTVLSTANVSTRLWATPASTPRFLLVFLRGGYDCANFLVPYSSTDYYALRPHIAIARPDPKLPAGSMVLDADWALAPAVRDSLGQLYALGQAAFIPFAGTDDLTRSHFETQETIELGQPIQDPRNPRSGFLARLVAVLGGSTPIAFTDALPSAFQGQPDIPNISLKSAGKNVFDERQSRILASMYAGHGLQGTVAEGLELRQEVSQVMKDEMASATRGALSTKGFELEAERMARLMRDQYHLGFVDVGGWDTHVNQGSCTGTLAANLHNLGTGLRTYAQTLGTEWNNTIVVVVSEFGRTFRENGNQGTDHGHGSVYWVLGGNVKGGRIVGEQVRVGVRTLFQQRDYPVFNDYRAVLGGLFGRIWGLNPKQLSQVFPATIPNDLGLI